MKYFAAVVLVITTLASAEPPRNGAYLARQQSQQPPYPARGVRPAGPPFSLPIRSQKQQLPPAPAASYGPPPQEYGPPPTTELPTTTETIETTTAAEPQTENFKVAPSSQKITDAPRPQQINPGGFYVVVPQTQNYIYSSPIASAKLVTQVQQPRLVPVQAVPALARIQEVPQIVEYQAVARPAVSSAYTSIVNTPFSSTFVQSFQ